MHMKLCFPKKFITTRVNSLWSAANWRHTSGSTHTQAKACCQMAPSHYLNQCWLNISKIQSLSSNINLMAISWQIPQPCIIKINSKSTCRKFKSDLLGLWFNSSPPCAAYMLVTYSTPSHYQNQCCFFLSIGPLGRNFSDILMKSKNKTFHSWKCIWRFEHIFCKMVAILPRGRGVNSSRSTSETSKIYYTDPAWLSLTNERKFVD